MPWIAVSVQQRWKVPPPIFTCDATMPPATIAFGPAFSAVATGVFAATAVGCRASAACTAGLAAVGAAAVAGTAVRGATGVASVAAPAETPTIWQQLFLPSSETCLAVKLA